MGKQRGKREGDLGFRWGAVVGGFGGLDGIHGLADLPREVGQGRAMILLPLKHQIGVVVPLVHLHYHLLLDHVPLIRVKHKPVRGFDASNHCCLLHRD